MRAGLGGGAPGAAGLAALAALAAVAAVAAVADADAQPPGAPAPHGDAADPPAPPGIQRGGKGAAPGVVPYWRFLGGVAAGDSFEYRICDSQYGPHAPPRPGHGGGWACYRAVLHVEAVVPVSGGRGGGIGAGADVHVVRAEVDWGGGAGDAGASPRGPLEAVLLVVDGGGGRLAVRHADPADRPVAESLQRTVFWRGGLGGGVALAYGEPAAELVRGHPSTALLVTGSRVSADGLVEYTAEHGPPAPPRLDGAGWRERAGQGTSSIVVAAGVGLPVSARVYAGLQPPLDHYHPGRPLFEYEMASFEQASARVARAGQAGAGDGGNGGTPRETAAEEGAPIANPHYSVHGGARRGRSLPRRGRGPAAGAARNGGGRGAW